MVEQGSVKPLVEGSTPFLWIFFRLYIYQKSFTPLLPTQKETSFWGCRSCYVYQFFDIRIGKKNPEER